MDASGDQSDEQQAAEKPIGIEEQKTIESQEAEAKEEASTGVNESPAITTEEIIGKAQEKEQSEDNTKQNVKEKSNQNSEISLQNYLIRSPNIFRSAR